jgi:hypothetical protein
VTVIYNVFTQSSAGGGAHRQLLDTTATAVDQVLANPKVFYSGGVLGFGLQRAYTHDVEDKGDEWDEWDEQDEWDKRHRRYERHDLNALEESEESDESDESVEDTPDSPPELTRWEIDKVDDLEPLL